jgi:thioredoxin reductase (NADPH)
MSNDPYDRPDQAFPRLSAEMVGRVTQYGRVETFDRGAYLYKSGDRGADFFLVLDGAVDILESDGYGGDVVVTTHRANEFTGELNLLSEQAAVVSARVSRPIKAVRVPRAQFRRMVSVEPEIGEVILRAFISRRMGLIQHAEGGAILVGSLHSGETLRIQRFLARNGYPYRFLDTEADPDARIALESFHVSVDALPVVIIDRGKVLRRPQNWELADALGISEELDPGLVYDVAVVGAGPAGLAAAVYAASEGLDTVVIEAIAPGGQAGSSSCIENYLGFPMGISGQGLAERAQVQAQKFGAQLVVGRPATALDCRGLPFRLRLEGETTIAARTVVVASGARYRRLDLHELRRFEGQGIYYAATSLEGRLCTGSDVVVVGGGNSAGQAAMFLSTQAKHVHLLVRGEGLADTMSAYLMKRIEESPRITLHVRSAVTALIGDEALQAVRWRERGGEETEHKTSNLFLMIGADPNTDWLNRCVALNAKGFVETGHLVEGEAQTSPYATSVPGIFAVGDVRANSVKRVASSVGEGSVVVHAIHAWLARSHNAQQPSEVTRDFAEIA